MAIAKSCHREVCAADGVEYVLVPPNGGWGMVVALAVTVVFGTVMVPAGLFGIVYGPFLASIGDETTATAMVNSVFNTVLCFTGLPANTLLQKSSYRVVGVMGAIIYFLGSFSSIFVTSSAQLVLTWGVLQGMGQGLMMPAVFTAFSHYFHTKGNAVMSMAQGLVAILNICFPTVVKSLMATFGFRGTVALLSAYGLHCIPAMLSLHPVKWHMKRQPLEMQALKCVEDPPSKELGDNCLLHPPVKRGLLDLCKPLAKSLDLGLFKQPSFVNIVVGISLSMMSDLAFLSIFPLLLTNAGLSLDRLTLVMTVFFSADLVSRIFLAMLTSFVNIRSRNLFLFGALFSAVFRILFVVKTSFWWIVMVSVALGSLRSLIQIYLPLVVAEAFPTRFATAFSLHMMVCGFVALSFGPLISFLKQVTGRLDMVVHFLTLAHIFCALPWLIEMAYVKFVKK